MNKDSLVTTGFCNWKRVLITFNEHEKNPDFLNKSMSAWASDKASKVHGTVADKIITGKHRLKAIPLSNSKCHNLSWQPRYCVSWP